MIRTTERRKSATRGRTFLRWMQGLLFVTGTIAVTYVAMTLLRAKLYQETAVNTLEKQIYTQEQQQVSLTHATAKEGEVVGSIRIPRLRTTVAILEGTTSQTLRLGVGHIKGTALPGEHGNVGIAGHRDTYFRSLKDIHTGDEIQIQTATGLLRYEVDWAQIVGPDATAVLAPSTESAVTLVTCYPFYFIGAAPQRFVVHARSIEQK